VPIGDEPRVACLPATHRLARRGTVTCADLQHDPVLDALAPRTATVEEKLERIAAGQGIAILPRSIARLCP